MFNSRHPDSRRVWKGGSEQHLLTPLPGIPRAPGAPGANSKKLTFVDGFMTIIYSKYSFFTVLESPALCVCVRAACGVSATSEKNTPWHFGACILWMLSMFVDFRVPPSTPWSMCLPQVFFFPEQTRPWNFGACIVWILLCPLPRNVSIS